jgi:hypothetical protein
MSVIATAMVAIALMMTLGSTANAAARYAFGQVGINNPSVTGGTANFERGPGAIGAQVSATGTDTVMTVPGRAFTLPAGAADFSGFDLNSFPGFAIVAQNSFSFMTTQPFAESFMAGGGAAAGGAIDFCPPQQPATPLQGNLSCPIWNNPGAGNYTVAIHIAQRPGGVAFGGTLRLMRNLTNSFNWFALPPFIPLGNTTQLQEVTKAPNPVNLFWEPGLPNYGFISDINYSGTHFNARLTTMGKIASLVSTLTTGTQVGPSKDIGWGFKMTTGAISGSDVYPPVGVTTPFFVFQTTGSDTVTPSGNIRNIVLLGGSISRSGKFGSLFNRISILDIAVPEPATLGGLAAGMFGLLALGRVRRS